MAKLLEKDQEIGNLHKRLDAQSIKVDTTQKLNDSLKLDIEKLKQQLLDSTNKESQLRKQLLQQQLEFEKQLEEFAKSAPGDNQTDTQLILSLHRQRDCALASLKQQEEEITRLQLELEREHQELQQTRNSTSSQLQAQAQHHAEEIKILQQDVSRLKATRDDIDVLQKQLKESSDCIAQLEAERQQHISQLRDLESKNERLVLAMKEMRLELEPAAFPEGNNLFQPTTASAPRESRR
ncbi:hypothetical protein Pelo_10103 [Pelomyxa schiedti]|nr:hypothetical protein Pelo_10103 [Pelomyxa schiedti]